MDLNDLSELLLTTAVGGLSADVGRCDAETSRKSAVSLIMLTKRLTSRAARHGADAWTTRVLLTALTCGMRAYLLAGRLESQDDDQRRFRSVMLLLAKTTEKLFKLLSEPDPERRGLINGLLRVYCEADGLVADDWERLYAALLVLKKQDDLLMTTRETLPMAKETDVHAPAATREAKQASA